MPQDVEQKIQTATEAEAEKFDKLIPEFRRAMRDVSGWHGDYPNEEQRARMRETDPLNR